MEGLIFGWAYVRREIFVSKSIGLAYSWKEFTVFALLYFVLEAIFQVQVPGGLIFVGDLTEGFFCVTGLGGLFSEFHGTLFN